MLVDCPACSSTFAATDAAIGAEDGRARCPRCGGVSSRLPNGRWVATGDHAVDLAVVPVGGTRRRKAARQGMSMAAGILLPVLFILGGAAAGAALAGRAVVAKHLPGTARLYAAIGLSVRPEPIVVRGLTSEIIRQGDTDILVVTGEIHNKGRTTAPVPTIRVGVQDSGAVEIYTWTVEGPRSTLEAGEAVPFRARLATPPETGRNVSVRLAPAAPTRLARSS